MTKDEFHSFLEFVYNEHMRHKIGRINRFFDKREMDHHMGFQWRRLRQALHIIDHIHNYCEGESDIYNTFQMDRLRQVVDAIEDNVRWNNKLAEKVGLLDALDQYFDEIISGITIEDFPEEEYDILQDFGFHNPKADLQGIMYLLRKRHKEKISRQKENISVSWELKHTVEVLSSAQEQFKDKDEEPGPGRQKKSRRWFKGLGKIGQGSAMSVADICLAAGVLNFPVSPQTKTYGCLVSVTAGVGMILDGVGELRGE